LRYNKFKKTNNKNLALTEQYVHFNRVLDETSHQGVSILAFPCNQFSYLEPGMNNEILNGSLITSFLNNNFHLGLKNVRPGHGYTPHQDLHIFGKIDVNGENEHPMYTFLKVSDFIKFFCLIW
jgi:glutathione peroxidase